MNGGQGGLQWLVMTEAPRERSTNRLIEATSPYLLQHAHNPVDWYEWGDEALERARAERKPILLSIGYAACHWCHVMAHESFEDPEIAALMNGAFVCIKVDREERPDLDAIYMGAVQAMNGHGGWPMTVFLTPDGEPFYAGTYFPPEDRHGLPGFPRLLQGMAEAWAERRDEVLQQGGRIAATIAGQSSFAASRDPLSADVLSNALSQLTRAFDREWGGFGPAPKFPQPMTFEFLLRMDARGHPGALEMVTTTLDRMVFGGIYDQLGGGFHRYSTDGRWLVPHFEKMLYDNAQLARLFLHAWQVTGRASYRRAATETFDYLLREMQGPEGGFFSAQDADSEGVEGKFFVWSWDELALTAGEVVARRFGASPEGNWEGSNVLWLPSGDDPPSSPAFEAARTRLFDLREQRVRPATDDKVLAGWNGLAVAAFAEAGRVLEEPRYLRAAERAAAFVLTALRRADGRLLRSWRRVRTSGPAFLEDHAMLADGCLELYQSTFDLRWMREARRLADDLLRLFADDERGGFYQTGADAETLLVRPKEVFDNAVPSGNSAAALVLQKLTLLTGEPEYERAATGALRLVRDLMSRAPTGFGHALGALDLYLGPSREVAVIGAPDDPATQALISEVWRRYLPNAVLAAAGPDDADAAGTIALLADRPLVEGRPAAYVCERFACRQPVTDPAALAAQLER